MSNTSLPTFDGDLYFALVQIVSETNGITLDDTLELLIGSESVRKNPKVLNQVQEYRGLLAGFHSDQIGINRLLAHPLSAVLKEFFRRFPIPYRDEHTHLTGALPAEFVFPRLTQLLKSPAHALYEKKITDIYGTEALPIESVEDVESLLRIKDNERFSRYLSILMLPKLLLVSRQAHSDAAFAMAKSMYEKYNVGFIRLKFSFSRATADEAEKVPGLEQLTSEDVVLGLYDGFMRYKKENPKWSFTLSPSFRKESNFFDNKQFKTKREHFLHQVNEILAIIDRHPYLTDIMNEVDTVGDETELYRKSHFLDMKLGFRKLQYRGFRIRSHHGEVWKTLKKGIQAVDNAMNIWRIDTLEHGLSLGMNPNFYFHSLYQRVLKWNSRSEAIRPGTLEYHEIQDMDWQDYAIHVKGKLLAGEPLSADEQELFVKAKFHTAREVELYQHDVLNRMIDKGVSLVALPSSNNKLSALFEDYKDHPFSWWEKKNLSLGIGTDNFVTLGTDFLQEMLILLITDPFGLKLTKLLMVATGENRRPLISHHLWQMRKSVLGSGKP